MKILTPRNVKIGVALVVVAFLWTQRDKIRAFIGV
jgi:hypothetical protein